MYAIEVLNGLVRSESEFTQGATENSASAPTASNAVDDHPLPRTQRGQCCRDSSPDPVPLVQGLSGRTTANEILERL